jgi:hypothetical protein
LTEATPDHSTLSRTRRLIDLETHAQVFAWVLGLLADRGLLQGKRIGIDATALEANAAMKSIVRRDTGESYNEANHEPDCFGDLARFQAQGEGELTRHSIRLSLRPTRR